MSVSTSLSRRPKKPRAPDFNHLATLVAILAAITIAALAGYSLQIGVGGLVFTPAPEPTSLAIPGKANHGQAD